MKINTTFPFLLTWLLLGVLLGTHVSYGETEPTIAFSSVSYAEAVAKAEMEIVSIHQKNHIGSFSIKRPITPIRFIISEVKEPIVLKSKTPSIPAKKVPTPQKKEVVLPKTPTKIVPKKTVPTIDSTPAKKVPTLTPKTQTSPITVSSTGSTKLRTKVVIPPVVETPAPTPILPPPDTKTRAS